MSLPKDIVERYANGSSMAVVGFELNQVRINSKGEEVTIPYSAVYNHHFESTMIGGNTKFQEIKDRHDLRVIRRKGHGVPDEGIFIVVGDEGDEDVPTQQAFGAANGGEARGSFHGYAPGFAQIIQSPHTFQITPMQIDTWNRDEMDLNDPNVRFVRALNLKLSHENSFTTYTQVPGPVPRTNLAPTHGVDAIYSGLLECPLTTRVEKVLNSAYLTEMNGKQCETSIATPQKCFEATKSLLKGFTTFENVTLSGNDGVPNGCSASVSSEGIVTMTYNSGNVSTRACGSSTSKMIGYVNSLVQVSLSLDNDNVNITITGPSDVWFGVGFGAQAMKDAPWAIIVENDSATAKVSERKLADQNPGVELNSSLRVISQSSTKDTRTVVLTRSRVGLDERYFTFEMNTTNIPIINAIGSTPQLSYHKNKSPAQLSLLPLRDDKSSGACICATPPPAFGHGSGNFVYHANTSQSADVGSGTVAFNNNCAPEPRSDLLAQKNPTCDIRTYVGGQITCHHMWSLLDADQEIPWNDQPIKYRLKFRFWYQDYDASYHRNVKRTTWGIASPVEYDVPKCSHGVPGCSYDESTNTWLHTITGVFKASGDLVAAHFHCHAPTCLSVQLYLNETRELLCREDPVYGRNEPGFILQPPCLWGDSEFGLEAPPNVDGKYLYAVKTSNATYGHHGEMAWLQMLYV